jgi:hypothetical protein
MGMRVPVLGTVFLSICLSAFPALAQDNSTRLSPSEAYKAALAPYTETRSQANDLTDADRFALTIGMAQASRDCLALSTDHSAYAGDAKELLALGQLCIFGQQFEPARAVLVDYLALPKPPQREQALTLLVRAFLGLKNSVSAEAQIESLLKDYPYDASIHVAMDQVIDSLEGTGEYYDEMARQLCAKQSAITLALLAKGKALEGADGGVSATTLFADGVRCAALPGAKNPESLDALAAIVGEPYWADTADLAPMQSALERQQMVGKRVPRPVLRGQMLGAGGFVPRAIPLRRGPVLLVAFTLWAPSTPAILSDLAKMAPTERIYAITSWRANTGREDVRSSEVLEGLLSWQRTMPKNVSLLVVPDAVLTAFHSDVFPVGIAIHDGTVVSNAALFSEGAERLLAAALRPSGRLKGTEPRK